MRKSKDKGTEGLRPLSLALSYSRPHALDFLEQMDPLIEQLVKLQEVDLDRARLNREIRGLPAEIARAEAVLAEAERLAREASAALSREETLRNRMEREIQDHRQKATRFRTQLDSVKTPAQAEAIEHEIQFAGAEVERIENEEFASLERTEAQEAEFSQARAQVELLAKSLETVRANVETRRQELAADLAALNNDREALRQDLDPDWIDRFDRLAAARGTALARAENQQCTACRMGLRPQTWNELREGALLTCDSCNRLLYWDPALAPAPQAPEPAPVPGQGRAIRKPSQNGA